MTPATLKILEFGDQLLPDEKATLLSYASLLMANLASGEYGTPPYDPEALEAFQEFSGNELPSDDELNNILGQLRNRRVIDKSLLPAMLATLPGDDLVDRAHFERIKAWVLLSATGLAIEYAQEQTGTLDEEDPRISCIRSATRRVRRMLMNQYSWMLAALPDFQEEITQLVEELETLRRSYPVGDDTHPHAIGIIHVLISNYVNHRLDKKQRQQGENEEKRRRLEPISIASTPGMADAEHDYIELVEAPKRDVLTVSQQELEGDQPLDSKYIQSSKTPKALRQQSLSMQLIQANSIANRIAAREMRLPCDWNTLTRYEEKTVLQQCWPKAINGAPADLVIVLCLLTGRDPERIIPLVSGSSREEVDGIYISDNHIALTHHPQLPTHFIPGEASQLVEAPADMIYLALPDELYKPIARFKNRTVKLPDDLTNLIDERISAINGKFRTRLSINRISGDLYTRAKRVSDDSADIALVCGHSAMQCPPLFYYSQNSSNPADLFSLSNAELFEQAGISPTYPDTSKRKSKVGSRLIIRDYLVSALFNEQAKRLLQLQPHANSDPIAFHNEFMLYTYQMLTLGTGHRPVSSPFQYRKDIDLLRRTIWISDKEVRSALSARTLVLPETLCQQIKAYDDHLASLHHLLALSNHPAAPRVKAAISSKLPYLFWIGDHSVQDIFPSLLKDLMADRWPLPLNWQRHYLRSMLKTEGVRGDAVNAWMGHAKFGEEAMGPWSGLSMATMQQTAAVIENKLRSLNILSVPGLQAI